MANRFLETNYFKSPFVKSLEGKLKSFYSFIICDCSQSGIWILDLVTAKHYIGFEVSMDEFEAAFIRTGKAIQITKGKYFFPDFIEHQYPSGLSDNNKAHKNILIELRKFNLIDEHNFPKKEAPLKDALESPLKGVQGNGNGLGNGLGNVNGTAIKIHDKPIGSEKTLECARKSWDNQQWREQTCMANGIREPDLKKWMSMFNASIMNDTIPHFSDGSYRKMFGGWLQKQKSKGYTVENIKSETIDLLKKL